MLVTKKQFQEKIEHILSHLEGAMETENEDLEYIDTKKGDPLACISFLANLYALKSCKNYLLEKDMESFKKNMYIYAKLELLSRDTRRFLLIYRAKLFPMLLSNHPDFLIFLEKYLYIFQGLPEETYKKSKADVWLGKTLLLAFRGEWEQVIARANVYAENSSKESHTRFYPLEFGFLKALAEKDVTQMKDWMEKMLEPKTARRMVYDMHAYFDFYLQIYAVIYYKLAAYHGFDLDIESDILPKELMDMTPASSYPEPYEFMKEFDLKTITPEEWKSWIYRYHPNPEELKEEEKEGIFI